MRHVLFAAVLAAAAPVGAQSVADPEPVDQLGQIGAAAKAQNAKLAAAPVDPKPVNALFDRLVKDGEQIQTEDGVQDTYTRSGQPKKVGRWRNLQVGVVEQGDPDAAADRSGRLQFRDLVMRRVFSTLEAQSEEWTAAKDGTGRVDLWHFTVSLDAKLLSVEHDWFPAKAGPDGKLQAQQDESRSERLAPSSPAVQARWKKLSGELLLLGRTTAI